MLFSNTFKGTRIFSLNDYVISAMFSASNFVTLPYTNICKIYAEDFWRILAHKCTTIVSEKKTQPFRNRSDRCKPHSKTLNRYPVINGKQSWLIVIDKVRLQCCKPSRENHRLFAADKLRDFGKTQHC